MIPERPHYPYRNANSISRPIIRRVTHASNTSVRITRIVLNGKPVHPKVPIVEVKAPQVVVPVYVMAPVEQTKPADAQYPKVTLTMTTCQRLEYFLMTIKSFYAKCKDMDLITEVIIGDDGSMDADVKEMSKYGKVVSNSKRGHDNNLNNLFRHVKTSHVFHLEDDWELLNDCHVIRKCFDVMKSDIRIKSVNVGGWGMVRIYMKDISYEIFVQREIDKVQLGGHRVYQSHGFSLNPGLFDIAAIRETGLFGKRVPEGFHCFENGFALDFKKHGFLRANMAEATFRHIGDKSAYRLNRTYR